MDKSQLCNVFPWPEGPQCVILGLGWVTQRGWARTLCSAPVPATGSEGSLFSSTSLVGHRRSGRLDPWLWDLLFFQLLNAVLDLDC